MMTERPALFSLNICGLAEEKKLLGALEEAMKINDVFIFCIQECKISFLSQMHKNILDYCKLSYFFVPGTINNSGGLLICYSSQLQLQLRYQSKNFILLKLENEPFFVTNVYINSKNASENFIELSRILTEETSLEDEIFLLGDFNCLASVHESTSTKIRKHDDRIINYNRLNKILITRKLIDLADVFNSRDLTHYCSRTETKARIDFIFTNSPERYNRCSTLEMQFSDHKLLFCVWGVDPAPRGQGLWKLNDDIFQSNSNFIKSKIENYFQINDSTSKFEKYESFKLELRETLREISINKNKIENNRKHFLQKKIQKLGEQTPCNLSNAHLEKYKSELQKLYMEELQRKVKNLKNFYLDLNEGDSATLKKWINRKNPANEISTVKLQTGETTENTTKIIDSFAEYFENIYSNKEVNLDSQKQIIKNFAKKHKIPKKDRKDLGKEFSSCEIEKAITMLNRKSAPGPDGLTSAIFKRYKKQFSEIFRDLFNECVQKESMPNSMQLARIKLLPKIENPISHKDYRPISLINTDQKIFSHVLCARFRKFMAKMVAKNQVAYLPGRQINTAIHFTRLKVEELKDDECIASLDFSKAFDKLDRGYIFNLLKAIKVPNIIRQSVAALYEKTLSIIEINGFFSRKILIEKGVRQGDPLSALLFILCTEPLVLAIEICKHIENICSRKSIAYADDIITMTTVQCLETLFDLVAEFCEATQLEVNIDKSEILTSLILEHHKSCKTFKTLGIQHSLITNKPTSTFDISSLLNKSRDFLPRRMSMRAKAFSLDTFIISKFLFQMRHNRITKNDCENLQKHLNQIVWGDKKHEIKQEYLFLPTELGGIGLPCVKYKVCVAKLMDWKTILFNEKEEDHANWLIKKYNGSKSLLMKNMKKFLSMCKIELVDIGLKNMKILFEGNFIEINEKTTFKFLYRQFVVTDAMIQQQSLRLHDILAKTQLDVKSIGQFLNSLWSTNELLPFQKDFFYRFTFGGIKDHAKLFSFKARSSAICRICNIKPETFEHLIFECAETKFYAKVHGIHSFASFYDSNDFSKTRFLVAVIMSTWHNGRLEIVRAFEQNMRRVKHSPKGQDDHNFG